MCANRYPHCVAGKKKRIAQPYGNTDGSDCTCLPATRCCGGSCCVQSAHWNPQESPRRTAVCKQGIPPDIERSFWCLSCISAYLSTCLSVFCWSVYLSFTSIFHTSLCCLSVNLWNLSLVSILCLSIILLICVSNLSLTSIFDIYI